MKKFISMLGFIIASFALLSACSDVQEPPIVNEIQQDADTSTNLQSVSGTIYAKQPIPPASGAGYLVNVVLADVSKMDVAATEIGSVSLTTKHLPIEYSISIDSAQIEPRMSYALQTRITDSAGKLVGVTDQHHKYTLADPNIGFDILVKAIQLEAPIPTQTKMTCGEKNYSLAIYPSLLAKTDLAIHNQHILPRVISASGEHFQSSNESIFMKGEQAPLVEINGESVSCILSKR
jgi:uncharacterized lipoprotein YbaY